jgi:hypothetical protein
MTSEHDKLLSEGPRMAPEPKTADGFAAPAPAEPTTPPLPADQTDATEEAAPQKPPLLKSPPQGSSPGGSWPGGSLPGSGGSWLSGGLIRRLIPLLLVLVVFGRNFAGGHSGSWVFLIPIAIAVLLIVLRARGGRRW